MITAWEEVEEKFLWSRDRGGLLLRETTMRVLWWGGG